MSDEPVEGASAGWLGGLYRWLTTRSGLPPNTPGSAAEPKSTDQPPDRIGPYTVRKKIGTGGMGVVYQAYDDRLQRTIALKMMVGVEHDDTARKRFWREARAAASVNHPHVCQIYEVGEHDGKLFIAMEMLEGQPLADHLGHGPLSVDQSVTIAIEMLQALGAIHARGIVHRDLKPSNVFLTPHGVKLLDFGLARPDVEATLSPDSGLTHTGVVMGTPRYMAPEALTGDTVDARSDLFAVGAILFEMLSGRAAFGGRTLAEVINATLSGQPPALAGSPAVAAVDRVIRRAIAKSPAGRPATADEMADQLAAARGVDGQQTRAMAQPLTRVVVLPFRVLRPDPETDFLAFSLPDAITTSLAGIGSLVVRSSATAARFATDTPDIKALAAEADVDRVVMGTLLRSGDQLRASTQLVEAPAGTLLTAHTVQSPLGDLFHMQDDIARRVVEGLALPLTGERHSPSPDAPRSPEAYEFYLRGNGLARTYDGMRAAREQYEQCLELDPDFAPAWAHLGRCHRVIGKYLDPLPGSDERAEQAFARAIRLNPRLSVAHKFYANLEADTGRAREAVVRLLNEALRQRNDPELFAGLVHACRYAGLLEESIAAHAEARRLDPNIATSVQQTLMMHRDVDRLIEVAKADPRREFGGDDGILIIALGLAGRRDEARERLAAMTVRPRIATFQAWTTHLNAWLDRRVDDMVASLSVFSQLKIFDDPEAIVQEGWIFCDAGDYDRGLEFVQRGIARGYGAAFPLATAPQFDPIRGLPAFQAVLADAEAKRASARLAFKEAGGDRLLAI